MKTHLTFGILIPGALLVINVANLTAEENWTQKADMPTARSGFATCIVNGKIYAIGGEVDKFGDTSIATVEMYDPKTDTWTQKTDLPTSRRTSTCVVDGKIYAIGGVAFNNVKKKKPWRLDTVEVYDPERERWDESPPMPTGNSPFGAEAVNGKIYILGSQRGNREFSLEVEVFDTGFRAVTATGKLPTRWGALKAERQN